MGENLPGAPQSPQVREKIYSKIPPDEVIDAMRSIGEAMPSCLKETSKGGLAVTPEGLKYAGGEEKV